MRYASMKKLGFFCLLLALQTPLYAGSQYWRSKVNGGFRDTVLSRCYKLPPLGPGRIKKDIDRMVVYADYPYHETQTVLRSYLGPWNEVVREETIPPVELNPIKHFEVSVSKASQLAKDIDYFISTLSEFACE